MTIPSTRQNTVHVPNKGIPNSVISAIVILCLAIIGLGSTTLSAVGATYYVDNIGGNDSNTGTATNQAWATLNKVDSFGFQPGDIIRFKTGGVWRGQLVPTSGDATGDVTYSSYGSDSMPVILGSVAANASTSWTNQVGNLWFAGGQIYGNQIPNSSFDTDLSGWQFYAGSGSAATYSRSTNDYATAPASCQISVQNQGTNQSGIQFYVNNLAITNGKIYRLTYKAKATTPFTMQAPVLIKQSSPFSNYYSSKTSWTVNVGSSWSSYTNDFTANANATDARTDFFLGNSVPSGSSLYLDDIQLQGISLSPGDVDLPVDVGNIVINNGAAVGFKMTNLVALAQQNNFWYDPANYRLYVYSISNPATLYGSIECALNNNIVSIGNKSYVTIDGLALSDGGAHGIGTSSCSYITIKNCTISYIGGSYLTGYLSGTTRYGNGIQFWENAHDCLVTNNNITQVYDTGITDQGANTNQQYNIYYKSNAISNCEWSFEIWDRPSASSMHDIYFENNACMNAGGGWSHIQRPDNSLAAHVMLFNSTASATNIFIRYNTMSNSTQVMIAKGDSSVWSNMNNLVIDYNTYTQPAGSVANWYGTWFDVLHFNNYQAVSGKDAHSTLHSAVVTVDNADEAGVTISGAWTATAYTAGYYGTNYLHDGNSGATGGKSVRFSPNLFATASYQVYLNWTAAANRASNTPVDVNFAGGTTNLSINQQVGGTWFPLGTFQFNAGTNGNVLIRNDGANGYVIADAVKFIQVIPNLTNVLPAEPAPSPIISPVFLDGSGTNLVLSATTIIGHSYVLESTLVLESPVVWSAVGTNYGTGGAVTNLVPVIQKNPKQFFRYRVQ
jgi:hypothetical protein